MMRSALLALLFAFFFLLVGWAASTVYWRGQHSMTAFMDNYATLAYLQKGDAPSAMLLLRTSTEAHLIEADKYGDLSLWLHSRSAKSRWFASYARLRAALPDSTKSTDAEFDQRVNKILEAAVDEVNANSGRLDGPNARR